MAPDKFFVSVIVPVYNGADFLESAIKTVAAQGYSPLEIIIVDDGSTDETAIIAKRSGQPVRYFYQPNRGPAAARNLGIKEAKGDVIAFLDVDDRWPADKLKVQLECLRNNPTAEIINGYTQFYKISGQKDGKLILKKTWKPAFIVSLWSPIFRKSVFEKIGYLDETLRSAEDVNWFFKAWEKGINMITLEHVTYLYLRHSGGISFGKNIKSSNFLKEIRKSIQRRRDQGGGTAAPLAPLSKIRDMDKHPK